MIQVAVVGANGRMGQLIVRALKEDPAFNLAAELSRSFQKYLKDVKIPTDIVIDFTVPEATLEHLLICKERGYRMIIGTTGFTELEKAEIIRASKHIPIVLAPNMSIGINVCYKLLELATQILKDQADIAILDVHHKHKKDAPSGTALRMLEIIKNAEQQSGSDRSGSINISSLRLGDMAGEHSAFFALPGECLEITHRTRDRSLFAKGALQAAKWLHHQLPGLYSMQNVLAI